MKERKQQSDRTGAEQAQFFSVFRSNGGKREANAKASHAREEE